MMPIEPLMHPDTVVTVPGSKSLTQRTLVIAALANSTTRLINPLIAEDTVLLINALRLLGATIERRDDILHVTGTGGHIRNPGETIYLGNNGTALRFLISLCALGMGRFVLDGSPRLRKRPAGALLEALAALGVESRTIDGRGCPPVTLRGRGILDGGTVTFTGAESSQYISSLLLAAPLARSAIEVRVAKDTVSRPYIDMTVAVMRDFGISIGVFDGGYTVPAPCGYTARDFEIEGDISSASYFFLAAAICRGKVRVMNIPATTYQGDRRFLDILSDLGCSVATGDRWTEVIGGTLAGGERHFHMADIPDMVPTVAVLAAYRPGHTVITGVPHLRLKESDRLRALASELTRIGIRAEERADGLVIEGGVPHGAAIETYGDHRIAMSFAIAGLATDGISITNESCVEKSYPGFWTALKEIYR